MKHAVIIATFLLVGIIVFRYFYPDFQRPTAVRNATQGSAYTTTVDWQGSDVPGMVKEHVMPSGLQVRTLSVVLPGGRHITGRDYGADSTWDEICKSSCHRPNAEEQEQLTQAFARAQWKIARI